MYISSLELADFRNIASLHMEFSQGTNILYGENAQGKTNILESMYMLSTTKSHRGVRDRDMIRFGVEEAHIRSQIMKGGLDHRIDMHLRKNKSKGIAIDGQRIRKASELIGLLHIVFFSPEDLGIVKNGPAERRRFMDMELCQLDAAYLHDLNQYNKTVENRNRLLRDMYQFPDLQETLGVWDAQLAGYGRRIIESRRRFIEDLVHGGAWGIHFFLHEGGAEEIGHRHGHAVDVQTDIALPQIIVTDVMRPDERVDGLEVVIDGLAGPPMIAEGNDVDPHFF